MDMLKEFEEYLIEQDKATLTVRGYLADLRLFSRWFVSTNGEGL